MGFGIRQNLYSRLYGEKVSFSFSSPLILVCFGIRTAIGKKSIQINSADYMYNLRRRICASAVEACSLCARRDKKSLISARRNDSIFVLSRQESFSPPGFFSIFGKVPLQSHLSVAKSLIRPMPDETRGRGRSLARAHSANNIHENKPKSELDGQPRSNSAHNGRNSRHKSDDLRHIAVRNGLRSSQLSLALSRAQSVALVAHNQQFLNKNIAMVPHEAKARPNWENSWSSFTLTQSSRSTKTRNTSVSSKDQKAVKSSISPLTKLGSNTSKQTPSALEPIARPPQGPPSTENRFDDLHDSGIQNKFLRSISEIQQLEPETFSRDGFSDHTALSSKSLRSSAAPVLKYASDLDSSDNEENSEDKETEEYLLEDTSDLATPSSLLAMAEEIQSFQKSFVGSAPKIQPTRTQRKILDLKDLLSEDAPVPGQNGLGSLDYMAKIQHEKIFAEWTQIRLRFSGHVQSKNTARCGAGVLGFVERYLTRGWPEPEALETGSFLVTKETKDSFLLNLWQSGQTRPISQTSSQADALPTSEPPSYGNSYVNSQSTPQPNSHPTLDEDEGDIYKENTRFNISSLAQVVIARQSPGGH